MKILIKNYIKNFLRMLGLEVSLYNEFIHVIDTKDFIPIKDNNFNFQLYNKGLKITKNLKSDNIYKQLRFLSLIQVVEHILKKNEVNDFVECGCWRGHSSFIISSLIKKNKKKINFYIFDSFEDGLSESNINDGSFFYRDEATKKRISKRDFYSSESFVSEEVLSEFNFVNIYPGWIPEKFNQVKDKNFSFVHIDVDLYDPTMDSLKFFYPRLQEGGAILCDDYNVAHYPGAKKAWDEFFLNKEYNFFYESPLGGCFIIK
jgi:O-methyltransferase|tara:strand:+ start:3770 stop:4549 length:780 start_codon:yes stop_codon:yes gene_type:complete